MKETKENDKDEITLETFKNIQKMIKSSNEEDFFIATETWKNMKPSNTLSQLLTRVVYLDHRSKLEAELGVKADLTLSDLFQLNNTTGLSDVEKEILSDILNEHIKKMLVYQNIVNVNFKLEVQWEK